MKGRAVALTVESVTALRNLSAQGAAQAAEGEHSQSAQGEGTTPPPPLRKGAAQETQGNRHTKTADQPATQPQTPQGR